MKRRSLLVMLAVAASFGCVAKSKYMHPAAAVAPERRQDMATVVFIRPSSYAGGMLFTVIDERGAFLGDSTPKSRFAVSLPPGKHMFISWAENTAALEAYLAPGKVYYVEVASKMGAWSARAHLLAITPRSESWPKLGEWLSETTPFTPDAAAGQAYLDGRKSDTMERVRRGQEAFTKYTQEEAEERILRPEDGQ